ncbi:hypothetical protein NDU88_007809 [Pleurodeles waltl]|uniref:Uncharacterized protein n=1 Tax=Pleurodeles waltl TaxID=8319 RepID=A0AAV7NBA4_PLEWA|nr:hypothetical protein NDU88_007809 [Pleurodeles waltl]
MGRVSGAACLVPDIFCFDALRSLRFLTDLARVVAFEGCWALRSRCAWRPPAAESGGDLGRAFPPPDPHLLLPDAAGLPEHTERDRAAWAAVTGPGASGCARGSSRWWGYPRGVHGSVPAHAVGAEAENLTPLPRTCKKRRPAQ